MHLADLLVLFPLAAWGGFALRSAIRRRKRGGCCGSCSSCAVCTQCKAQRRKSSH